MASEQNKKPRLTFGLRMILVFVGLLLAAQAATLAIVEVSVNDNMRREMAEKLEVGTRAWRQAHEGRLSRLEQSVSKLATDRKFRKIAATKNTDNAFAALKNYARTINARAALLLNADGSLRATTVKGDESAQVNALFPLLDSARVEGGTSGVVTLQGAPYEMAVVPVMAPYLVGWVAMGRPFDDALARNYHVLTGLDVAFATPNVTGWRVHATSLEKNTTQAFGEMEQLPASTEQLALGQRHFYFSNTIAEQRGRNPLRIFLLADVEQAMRPYEQMKSQIMWLATLAAGLMLIIAMMVGEGMSRPVAHLADAARRFAQGDRIVRLQINGRDELSELAGAFNSMQEGIADREAKILHQENHDRLTSLPNRNYALQALQNALESARVSNRRCAVLMLDLDQFKEINDTLGYDVGDGVLTGVAKRLRQAVRKNDLLARLGGDEFMVLLENADETTALECAWRLIQTLDSPFELADGQTRPNIDASIGVVIYPDHAESADELLRRADVAMYEAKQAHARVGLYEPGHDEVRLRQTRLISDLRRARQRGELQLVFQPKIDLIGRRVAHVEALLRWKHSELGPIGPDEFIPLAERSGLIHEITHFVVDQGLRDAAAWRNAGIDVGLAVNLSALDIVNAQLPGLISSLLSRHDFPATELILEITESTVMRDMQAALVNMHALREMGIRLSIDDFGSGYSSLSQLRSLPVDELKIDRSFVMQLEKSPDDTVIVRSAIEIGHNMGLTVIAEGVEQDTSLQILRKLNCDMVQGYLFSKPVSAESFCEWHAAFEPDALLAEIAPQAVVAAL